MKKKILFLTVLIISLVSLAIPLKDFIITDFNDAFIISKLTGKKVIIMFSEDNCYYCQKFKNEVLTDLNIQKWLRTEYIFAEITARNKNLIIFRNKTYTYPQLFGAFGVRGTPTFVFFENEETILGSLPGFVETKTFENLLKYLLFEKNTTVSFENFVKNDYKITIKKKILTLNSNEINTLLKIDPNTKKYNKKYDKYTNVVIENEKTYDNFIVIKSK